MSTSDKKAISDLPPLPEQGEVTDSLDLKPVQLLSRIAQLTAGVAACSWIAHLFVAITSPEPEPTSLKKLQSATNLFGQFSQLKALSYGLSLIAILFFVAWFFRAYKNLDGFAAASESPQFAALSWVIPIINFYVPAKLTEELYQESSDESKNQPFRLVHLWWLTGPVCFLVSQSVSILISLVVPSFGILRLLTALDWVTNFSFVCCGLVTVFLVEKITKVQSSRLSAVT